MDAYCIVVLITVFVHKTKEDKCKGPKTYFCEKKRLFISGERAALKFCILLKQCMEKRFWDYRVPIFFWSTCYDIVTLSKPPTTALMTRVILHSTQFVIPNDIQSGNVCWQILYVSFLFKAARGMSF